MLKIAVDATPIREKPSGIGLYVFNLINSLSELELQEEFQLTVAYQPSLKKWLRGDLSVPNIFDREIKIKQLPLPVTISNLLAKFPNPILPYLEPCFGFPDIIHGADSFVYPCQKSLRVMTIPDLTFIKYPAYVSSIVRTYSSRVKQCLKWTDLVITISQSSKRDIVEYLGFPPEKIQVTYLASRYSPGDLDKQGEQGDNSLRSKANPPFIPPRGELGKRHLRQQRQSLKAKGTIQNPKSKIQNPMDKGEQGGRGRENRANPSSIDQLPASIDYDFSKPYLLFVSTLEPRKNIITLIEAFNFLKQKYKIEHQLVLIGQKGWAYKPILAAIETSPWKHHIHQLDYLPDQLLAWFYSKADVFVYPSYYEGFGLPVLEAMTWGTPVVTSNTASLPEVAGDAALMIDPYDPTQVVDAILKVIGDSQLRQELIQKGKERAKLFSWKKTAEETLKAYKSLLR